MKLSQLLRLKQDLMRLDTSSISDGARLVRLNTNAVDFLHYSREDIDSAIDKVMSSVAVVNQLRDRLVRTIDQDIETLKSRYLMESEQHADKYAYSDIKNNREIRVMHYNPGVEETILARIGQYVTWETPGMEIGPGDGRWTKHLVSLDPLYIVDIHEEFLNSTVQTFNKSYQSRIRPYLVDKLSLRELPREQMGFVFAWNVFNYFSLSMIERYLKEIKLTMRPGAIMMFSYNNGELYKSVELFENRFMTYVPSTDLINAVKRLGFELVDSKNIDTHVSWLEIRNPGKLESNRAGQTLGKIIDQSA